MRFHDGSICAPIPHVGSTTKSRFNAQNISKSPWVTLPSRKFPFSIDPSNLPKRKTRNH
jgi:hypothetical protein